MSKSTTVAKPTTVSRGANAERGEIALELEGTSYILRPSFEAIDAFEVATGKGLFQLAREALEMTLRLGEAAQIAAECIRAAGRATGNASLQGVNAARIAELILESKGGFTNALKAIASMLALASTGGYTAQGEVKAGTTTTNAVPAAN